MKHGLERPIENRLSRFAAGVQEACWLGAACMIPLLVNPRAVELGYSPFKNGVWIMLSAIGMSAWMIRAVVLGFNRQSVSGNSLLIVLGLLGLSGSLSVGLSVNESASIWGAPETFQGISAWLAALSLAALVSCNLRTPEQLRRLVSVIILSGFAAGLLAILQRAGFDPNHPQMAGARCHSTAGHSIYLAGYLLMTLPLTLWRLIESRRLASSSRWAEAVIGTLILLVQIAGFVCAESRGPTVGLIAMFLAYSVFLAVHCRSKRWLAALCGLVAVGVIGVGVISLAKLPEDFGSNVPILKRFLQTKAAGAGFDHYRAEMWKYMPQMMLDNPPLPNPSGVRDGQPGLRLLVGYGPETLQSVLPQFMSNGAEAKIENRFHNLLWDQLFSYGILGTLSLLMAIFLTFYRGFQKLDWISSQRDSLFFFATIVSSGAIGAGAAGVTSNAGFIGLGTLCGIAAGTMVFAVIQSMRALPSDDAQRKEAFPGGLLIALLAGLVGHLVDMAFVFHSAPTAVMFWLSIGMVHAARYLPLPSQQTAASSLEEIISRPLATTVLRPYTLSHGALLALGVVTLLFGFLHQYSHPPMTFSGILKGSLFQLNPSAGQPSLLWIMPVALLLVGGTILTTPIANSVSVSLSKRALNVTSLALLIGGIYCILQIYKIQAIGSVPIESAPISAVLAQAAAYEQLFFTYLAVTGLLLTLAAWDLARPYPSPVRTPVREWVATGLVGAASVFFCWQFSLRPLRANLHSQWASALTALGRPEFAAEMYRRAIQVDPQPFLYRWLLATSLMDSASRAQEATTAQVSYAESEAVLLNGIAISESNRSHMILGQLYFQRSLGEPSPAREVTAGLAAQAFAKAIAFEPHQEQPWTYASITDRLLLHDPEGADKKLSHALQLPSINLDVVPANYAALGLNTPDPRLRAEFARIATLYMDRIIATADPQRVAMAKFEKARLMLANRGNLATVEILLREAIPNIHSDSRWKANGLLAEILIAKGDSKGALIVLQNGLPTAPERMRKPITELIIQLGGTP